MKILKRVAAQAIITAVNAVIFLGLLTLFFGWVTPDRTFAFWAALALPTALVLIGAAIFFGAHDSSGLVIGIPVILILIVLMWLAGKYNWIGGFFENWYWGEFFKGLLGIAGVLAVVFINYANRHFNQP